MKSAQFKYIQNVRHDQEHHSGNVHSLVPRFDANCSVTRVIRYFRKKDCDFVGEFQMEQVELGYLQLIFSTQINNLMLLSYRISERQLPYIERLTGKQLDLSNYDYFMECDISKIDNKAS